MNLEEVGNVFTFSLLILNAERESLVNNTTVVDLAAVHRRMDLEADVEELPGEEIGLVGREHTSEGGACAETLERLCRDKTSPKKADKDAVCPQRQGECGHFGGDAFVRVEGNSESKC